MPDQNNNWKTKAYAMGLVSGAVLGLFSAYLYARAAEEDATIHGGKPQQIGTLQLIGLFLALLGLVRQIAELGKSPKKK